MGKAITRSLSEAALDRAMRIFWERGYYDTPIEDLIARAGLNRAAIYGEFGSKKKLFEALLTRYREKVTADMFAPLQASDAASRHLEQFFGRLRDFAASPGGRFGCLMCHTASEVSPHIRSVARIVSVYLDELHTLFRRACVNARRRGEMHPGTDTEQAADYLAGAVLGLMALARSPAPRTAVVHYADGIIAYLGSLQQKRVGDTRWRPSGKQRNQDRAGRR
jgi:TetR/AcrR family transcriptional regulator, transcriptional repressor for nem operon